MTRPRRRRSLLPIFLLVVFANCPNGCPTPTPTQPFRCTQDNQCSFYQSFHCDQNMQTCVGTCGRNQVVSTDRDGITSCVDDDGPGKHCQADNDCLNGYSCRELVGDASADPSLAPLVTSMVCVANANLHAGTCGAPGGGCADVNPSNVIDAKCVDARKPGEQTASESACLELCFPSPPPSSGDPEVCRPDQVAVVGGNRCVCKQQDPYGTACPPEREHQVCNGLPEVAWVGDPRECRQIAPGNFRCVDTLFCIAETLSTCTNGADENCNAIAENVESVCQVEVCPDHDGDGYTEVSGCMMAYVGAIPAGFSKSPNKEATSCDDDGSRAPPFIPDQNNPQPNDECFACINNFCLPWDNAPGQGCTCPTHEHCNASSYQCELDP